MGQGWERFKGREGRNHRQTEQVKRRTGEKIREKQQG